VLPAEPELSVGAEVLAELLGAWLLVPHPLIINKSARSIKNMDFLIITSPL